MSPCFVVCWEISQSSCCNVAIGQLAQMKKNGLNVREIVMKLCFWVYKKQDRKEQNRKGK